MTDAGGLGAIKRLGDQAGEPDQYGAHSLTQAAERAWRRLLASRQMWPWRREGPGMLPQLWDSGCPVPGTSLGDAEFARFCLETLEEQGAGASSGHTWTVETAFSCLVAKEGLCGTATAQPDGRAWRSPFMETAACEDNKNSGLLEKISKPAVPTMAHRHPPPNTSASISTSGPQNFARNA